jgi:serine-type D-Ala-D-Ala carboxypeptidase/endopeptidase (penicillin-binding protein 4)
MPALRLPARLLHPAALLAIVCLAGANALASTPAAADATGSLSAALSNHVHQPRFERASWGMKIVSLDTGAEVFAHHAGKLHKPASNAKLFTGALALDKLGPQFRIRTSLYAAAAPDRRGRVEGDLIVYGRGDPCFSVRFDGVRTGQWLDPLAQALFEAGVREVRGDLVADESFFRGPPYGGSWSWEDLQYYYGAPVSALTVQDNTVDLEIMPGTGVGEPCRIAMQPPAAHLWFVNLTQTVVTGGRAWLDLTRSPGGFVVEMRGAMPLDASLRKDAVSVPDPARWFGLLLQDSLARHGIRVRGDVRPVDWRERELRPLSLENLVELAAVDSRPMAEIVTAMMKPSQNLYAQLLLLQVGAQAQLTNRVPANTESAGLAELGRFLERAGIPRGSVLFDEGSGLSRAALVTPEAIVGLLRFMDRHPQRAAFLDSLPVAGVDGTLRLRMRGTPAAGNVRAKTGTIRFVNTLSGYVTTAAGERLAFALMLNNHAPGEDDPSARADLDRIAVLLAEFTGRTRGGAAKVAR